MKLAWWFILMALLVCTALLLPFLPVERLTLIFMEEGLAAIAFVYLTIFYKKIIKSYKAIANGVDLLKTQDYSIRMNKTGQPEADEIVELFNMLIDKLRSERLSAQEQNMLTSLLVKEMPMGMVVMDFDGRVQSSNPAAVSLFRSIDTGLPDTPQLTPGCRFEDFDTPLCRALASLPDGSSQIFRFGGSKICKCSRLSFLDRGFRHPFVLIESLSEEIIAAERKSYSSVIRMISHEVGNTVAGITATLDIVSEDIPNDVRPAVDACTQRCNAMSRFVSRYAEVVKLPEPEKILTNVLDEIEGMKVILENMCSDAGVALEFSISGGFSAMLDPAMFSQAVINIVKNSIESPGVSRVQINLSETERCLEICDNGEGIDPSLSGRLFSPFFTTKESGQGLGLMLTGEILSRHNIAYSLETHKDNITRFRMVFPSI